MAEADDNTLMPDDAALSRVIEAIDTYNAGRSGVQRTVYLKIALYFVPFIGVLAVLVWRLWPADRDDKIRIFLLVAIIFGAIYGGQALWKWVWQPATDLKDAARQALFPEIFGFVDGLRHARGTIPRFMSGLPASAVIRYTRVSHDDMIQGSYNGSAFELGECSFWQKQGKGEIKEFQGILFHTTVDQPFPGILVISKLQSAANRFWFGGPDDRHLSQIGAADPEINRLHALRSDATGAARALIDGALGKAVSWLDRRWSDGITRIVLRGKDIFLFLPTDANFFELPPIGVDVDFRAHVAPMIHDLFGLLNFGQLIRKALMEEHAATGEAAKDQD